MMYNQDVILVANLDAVTLKLDQKYAHPSMPGRWFEIELWQKDEYYLNVYMGPFTTNCICKGDRIVTWSTFAGVVRFIKRQAVNPEREHHSLFKQFDAPSEQAKYDAILEGRRQQQAEWDEARRQREVKHLAEFEARTKAETEALEEAVRVLRLRGFVVGTADVNGYRARLEVGEHKFDLEWVEPR